MNSIERFFATVDRKPVDRPAAWIGMPDIKAQPALFEHYGVRNMHELKIAVGDDYGWEYIGRCIGWLYFRKPLSNTDTEQEGEIFSDNES